MRSLLFSINAHVEQNSSLFGLLAAVLFPLFSILSCFHINVGSASTSFVPEMKRGYIFGKTHARGQKGSKSLMDCPINRRKSAWFHDSRFPKLYFYSLFFISTLINFAEAKLENEYSSIFDRNFNNANDEGGGILYSRPPNFENKYLHHPLTFSIGGPEGTLGSNFTRENYVWVFRNLTLTPGVYIKINVPAVVRSDGTFRCLQNVTIIFDTISSHQNISVEASACIINCSFKFQNIRSAPIPRWSTYPVSLSNTSAFIDDGNLFNIFIGLAGPVTNSTFSFCDIIGPVLDARLEPTPSEWAGLESRVPDDGTFYPPGEFGLNLTSPRQRKYFRASYSFGVPLVGFVFHSRLVQSAVSIQNVLQVQYGPWRYIRPRLVEILSGTVASAESTSFLVQNVSSISQFVFERRMGLVRDPNAFSNFTDEEDLSISLAGIASQEGLNSTYEEDGTPPTPVIAKIITDSLRQTLSTSREFLCLFYYRSLANAFVNNTIVFSNIRVLWHKSILPMIIHAFFNASETSLTENFASRYALVDLKLSFGLAAQSESNVFSVSNVSLKFVRFESLTLSPPFQWVGSSLSRDSRLLLEHTSPLGPSATTIKNAVFVDKMVESFIFMNSSETKYLGISMSIIGGLRQAKILKFNFIFNDVCVNATTGNLDLADTSLILDSFLMLQKSSPRQFHEHSQEALLAQVQTLKADRRVAYENIVRRELAERSLNPNIYADTVASMDGESHRPVPYGSEPSLVGISILYQQMRASELRFTIDSVVCVSSWSCSGVLFRLYGRSAFSLRREEGMGDILTTTFDDPAYNAMLFSSLTTSISSCALVVRNVAVVGGIRSCIGVSVRLQHGGTSLAESNVTITDITALKGTLVNYGVEDVGVLISAVDNSTINQTNIVISDVFTNSTAVPVVASFSHNATVSSSSFLILCKSSRNANRAPDFDELRQQDLRNEAENSAVRPADYRLLPSYLARYVNPLDDMRVWDARDDIYKSPSPEASYDDANNEGLRMTPEVKSTPYVVFTVGAVLRGFANPKTNFEESITNYSSASFVNNMVTVRNIAVQSFFASSVFTLMTPSGYYKPFNEMEAANVPSANVIGNESDLSVVSCPITIEGNVFTLSRLRLTSRFGSSSIIQFSSKALLASFPTDNASFTLQADVMMNNNTFTIHDLGNVGSSLAFRFSFFSPAIYDRGSIAKNKLNISKVRSLDASGAFHIDMNTQLFVQNVFSISDVYTWSSLSGRTVLFSRTIGDVGLANEVTGNQFIMTSLEHVCILRPNGTKLSDSTFVLIVFSFPNGIVMRRNLINISRIRWRTDAVVLPHTGINQSAATVATTLIRYDFMRKYFIYDSLFLHNSLIAEAPHDEPSSQHRFALHGVRLAIVAVGYECESYDTEHVYTNISLLNTHSGSAVLCSVRGVTFVRNTIVANYLHVSSAFLDILETNSGVDIKSTGFTFFAVGTFTYNCVFAVDSIGVIGYPNGVYTGNLNKESQFIGVEFTLSCEARGGNFYESNVSLSNVKACSIGVAASFDSCALHSIFFQTIAVSSDRTNSQHAVRFLFIGTALVEYSSFHIHNSSLVNAFPREWHAGRGAVVFFRFNDNVTFSASSTIEITQTYRSHDMTLLQSSVTNLTAAMEGLALSQKRGAADIPVVYMLISGPINFFASTSLAVQGVVSSSFRAPFFNITSIGVLLVVSNNSILSPNVSQAFFSISNVVADGIGVRAVIRGATVTLSRFTITNIVSNLPIGSTSSGKIFPSHLYRRGTELYLILNSKFFQNAVKVSNSHGSPPAEATNSPLALQPISGGGEGLYLRIDALTLFVTRNTFELSRITSLSHLFDTPALFINVSGLGAFDSNSFNITNVANMQPDDVLSTNVNSPLSNYYTLLSSQQTPATALQMRSPQPVVLMYISPGKNDYKLSARRLLLSKNSFKLKSIVSVQFYNDSLSLDEYLADPLWLQRPTQLAFRFLQIPVRGPHVLDGSTSSLSSFCRIFSLGLELENVRGGIDVDAGWSEEFYPVLRLIYPPAFGLHFNAQTLAGDYFSVYEDSILRRFTNANSTLRKRIVGHRAPISFAFTSLNDLLFDRVYTLSSVFLRHSDLSRSLTPPQHFTGSFASRSNVTSALVKLGTLEIYGGLMVWLNMQGSFAKLQINACDVTSVEGDYIAGPIVPANEPINLIPPHKLSFIDNLTVRMVTQRYDRFLEDSTPISFRDLQIAMAQATVARNSVFVSGSLADGASVEISRITAPRLVLSIDAHECLPAKADRSYDTDLSTCKISFTNSVLNASELFAAANSPLPFYPAVLGHYPPTLSILGPLGDGVFVFVGENKIIGSRIAGINETAPLIHTSLAESLLFMGMVKRNTDVFSVVHMGYREPKFDTKAATMGIPYNVSLYQETAYPDGPGLLSGHSISFFSNTVGIEGSGWARGHEVSTVSVPNDGHSRCTLFADYAPEADVRSGPCFEKGTENGLLSLAYVVFGLFVGDGPMAPNGLKSLELWGNYIDPIACHGGLHLALSFHGGESQNIRTPLRPSMFNESMITIVQNVMGIVNASHAREVTEQANTTLMPKIHVGPPPEHPDNMSFVRRWACNLIVLGGRVALGAEGLVLLSVPSSWMQPTVDNNRAYVNEYELSSRLNASLWNLFGKFDGAYASCGLTFDNIANQRGESLPSVGVLGSSAGDPSNSSAVDAEWSIFPMVPRAVGSASSSRQELFETPTINRLFSSAAITRCHESINSPTPFTPQRANLTSLISPLTYIEAYRHRSEPVLKGAVGTRSALRSSFSASYLHRGSTAIGARAPMQDLYPATRIEGCDSAPPRSVWKPLTFSKPITRTPKVTSTISLTVYRNGTESIKIIEPTPSQSRVTVTHSHELLFTLKPIPALVSASEQATVVTGAVVSVVAVVGGVTGAGQLGVANAMTRLASCSEDGDNDGAELPILVHPLRFTLYTTSGGDGLRGLYAASVIGNVFIIPCAIAAFSLGPLQLLIRLVKSGGDISGVARDTALADMGWPSLLIMPFITLAEGIGVGIVRCFRGGAGYTAAQDTLSIAVGFVGSLGLSAFCGAWVWILLRMIPRAKVTMTATRPNVAGLARLGRTRRLGAVLNEDDELTGMELTLMSSSSSVEGVTFSSSHKGKAGTHGHSPCLADMIKMDVASVRNFFPYIILQPLWRWTPIAEASVRQTVIEKAKSKFNTLPAESVSSTQFGHSGDEEAAVGTPPSRVSHLDAAIVTIRRSDLRAVNEADMERFGNAVGDKRLYYAEIISFGCSLIVGIAEGVPSSYCKPRAVVALLAAVVQCGCSIATVVPAEFLLQFVLSLCIIPLSCAVTVKVFLDVDETKNKVDAANTVASGSSEIGAFLTAADGAIAALSLLGNVIGLLLMALGILRGVWGILTSYRTRRAKHRSNNNNDIAPTLASACVRARADTMLGAASTVGDWAFSASRSGVTNVSFDLLPRSVLLDDDDGDGESSSGGENKRQSSSLSPPSSIDDVHPLPVREGSTATPAPTKRRGLRKHSKGDNNSNSIHHSVQISNGPPLSASAQSSTSPRQAHRIGSYDRDSRLQYAIGYISPRDAERLPPSFSDFRGPMWQATMLHEIETRVVKESVQGHYN